jgi:serine/threonine-protein kinase
MFVKMLPEDTRLGAYRIGRMLGEGGMGCVYEATHEALNRRSAIKMLRPELATDHQIVTRFLNEARAVNLIDHPNIVNIYDYGDDLDGSVYLVMELLEGESLDDLMRRRQPMEMPLLLHLFGQIARALAAAHGKQIVHRDLKPANVHVIARENNPCFIKLLDFGIAQLRGAGVARGFTDAGMVMGTPEYMSPEQISGGSVDARSDVWAMGVMMYRAATGQAPFEGATFAELADQIQHHVPQPAGEIVELPAALSRLIRRCLERRAEDRLPSIAELIAGLAQVKRERKLDDDAILAAVLADAGAIPRGVPAPQPGPPGRLVEPAPRDRRRASSPGARWSQLAIYVAIAASAGALGSMVHVTQGCDRLRAAAPPPTIADLVAAGDAAGARARAELDLRAAIASGTPQQQGLAIEALGLTRAPAAAPLLYAALDGPVDIRVQAARALGELALPDAAPKVRAALVRSGGRIAVELAAVLYRLGDKGAQSVLLRAIGDPSLRLTAAIAMAESSDAAGRAVLAEILNAAPRGADPWRRAAGGLVALGDANARKLLESELTQPDATRSIGAAELLARAGDDRARALLARDAADPELARQGDAAAALARLGDERALGWVARGLESADVAERRLALSICGRLAAGTTAHAPAIAKLVTDDPDARVRMIAEAVLLGLRGNR